MSLHPVEQAVKDFLSASAEGKAPFKQEVLDQCLESIKLAMLDSFHGEPEVGKPFRLRMSNIGRDLRQLLLEKTHGRVLPNPSFMLKMLTGHIQEQTLVYILRSAGLEFETSQEVELNVGGEVIQGTYDLRLTLDNKIYDIKTASEWSFKNKFTSYRTLAEDDSFGYIDQLLGYAEAAGAEPGGWIVINKSTGEVKVVVYPNEMAQVRQPFLTRLAKRIADVASGRMPPCKGVVPETFYQKPTGNQILDFHCRFCDHKKKCHPTVSYEPSRCSKAKDKPMVFYVNPK